MTDPDDETRPHPTPDEPAAPQPPAASAAPLREEPASSGAPLRADPDRPRDPGWREPPWIPAREDRRRTRDRGPSTAALVIGLALIAVGVWLFLERTLGIALPRIAWGSLWPVVLIVLGGVILVRSVGRRA